MSPNVLGALQPRRLLLLFLVAVGNVAIWMLIALFATSEFYHRAIVMGGQAYWDQVLIIQMITAFNWALFTPFVVLLAQRLSLQAPHRIRGGEIGADRVNGVLILVFIPFLALFRAAFGGAVLDFSEHGSISMDMLTTSIGVRTHRDIAILAAIFFISNLADAHRDAARHDRQRIQLQTQLTRVEIDELRTRLQPRFAVRMLRHIGSVLRDEPAVADALIVNLSGVLRQSMARRENEWLPLADELEHLDRCLDLCRAGGRFPVAARYLADDDVLACRVPALILQPVIESVVLDLTASTGGSVEVRCTRVANDTRIQIASTAAAADLESHEQSAAAVRARLAPLYGTPASVHVVRDGRTVLTILRIPYRQSATTTIFEEPEA